jgi:tripartite-type tricarboxylate transporter receptor subunit TctC
MGKLLGLLRGGLLHALIGVAALAAVAPGSSVAADGSQEKPQEKLPGQAPARMPSQIRILIPRLPGGGTDNLMRLLAPKMQQSLGVPIILENKPDHNAIIAAMLTAQAKPDGSVLYASDNAFYTNPGLIKSVPYDPIKAFDGITMLANGPVVLIANKDVPFNTLAELIAYGKTHDLSFASGGVGASTHLIGVQMNKETRLNILHVPFNGSGAALTALLSGTVQLQFGGLNSTLPLISSGKVKAIAVSGDQRYASAPDIPTFKELGYPGVDVMSLWGLHAAAGTPLAIRMKIRDAAVQAMADPQVKARMLELGYVPFGSTPQQHQAETVKLIDYWIEMGKTIHIEN